MKKKLILLLVILIAVAGGFAYRTLYNEESAAGQLTLYGNVDIRKADLGFRVGGRIAEVLVEEGDRVQPGQLLARLDKTPYQDELNLAQAQLEQAAARLKKMEAGTRPQEIAQAAALVRERQASVKNLQTDYQRQKDLIETGAVSQQSFDNTTAALAEAEARLATAREGLNLAREGFRSEDIEAARADLQASKARLAGANTRLADTEIKAPQAGIILTRVEEPGAIVASGQIVLTLALDTPLWIRAYVAEPDLGRVYPGMPAKVYTDSAPDRPYKGQVGFISPEAEFTPKSVQTEELRTRLVYQLRIVADNPDHGLRQGMPVTVRLMEKERQARPE
ncbi:MAG: secretion protein HlyD [Proteobacteria bacterium]|nr:secretion protein HlyD [Pseudomonadota bacterium]MBU4294805.1 secretion protein HlyD [Pseudomonadota bacterium]MCG2748083.1 secretion protein HlyD [Desulfobulbaceae bacterium]